MELGAGTGLLVARCLTRDNGTRSALMATDQADKVWDLIDRKNPRLHAGHA